MKAIYGKKLGMTRVFTENGQSVPVTVLELGPNVVHQLKVKERDGYEAVQVGYGEQKPQRLNRAESGHLSRAKKGFPKFIGEIRLDQFRSSDDEVLELGQEITIEDMFEVGSKVDVRGTSAGKGFAGVVKRHKMSGVQTVTHGTHEYFRHGGSIGNRKFPGRVFKNKRMPGRMGTAQVVQEGLTVIAVRAEDNAILVKGSVPGPKNQMVFVRQSVKHSK